jgi:Condensation domain
MSLRVPLTFQQQSLWKLSHQFPEWKCTVPYAFCIRGELDAARLRRSLEEVTRRHGSLRARLSVVDGIPAIETGDAGACAFEEDRLIGHSRSDLELQAGRIFSELATRIVDPAVGPLWRLKLLELGEHEHWLLVAVHRLIADCFSAEQLFQELWAVYSEFSQGKSSPFSADPPQYSDYACWQQTHGQEWLQRHEEYWNKRLAGAESIRWPVDAGAMRGKRGATGMMSIHLGGELSARLQAFARKTHSLSAMVMLSAYIAVLWRWCRQQDFVVPFYVAGRQSEHKSVVGYFSHVLYLRIELTGQETFKQLLGSVSNEFFRALAHQDFGKQAAERPQFLAGAFCQWVTWHTQTTPKSTDSSLRVERLPLSEFGQGLSILPPAMVDVDLTFFDTTEGIYAQGVYRADRFEAQTMDRLMRDLRAALERFMLDPSGAVAFEGRLPLLGQWLPRSV